MENRIATCYITGAAQAGNIHIQKREGDYIIAADGGYSTLIRSDIRPDLVIGDFDSLAERPLLGKVLTLPEEKDDTDMLFAVKHALGMGYQKIVLFGGLGGRLDHTLANIQTLSFICDNGAKGFLAGEGTVITVIKNESIVFDAGKKGIISVFCHGDKAEGVYLKGLKYPLENATLTCSVPLGVSNEFTGRESSVTVENGRLAVIWNEDEWGRI